MGIIPISGEKGINLEEYWQVQALSIEWLYVLDKLGKSIEAKPEDRHVMVGVGMGGITVYFLKKSFYPTERMMKATGLSKEQLEENHGVIKLKAKEVKDLPEPTVAYWGEA